MIFDKKSAKTKDLSINYHYPLFKMGLKAAWKGLIGSNQAQTIPKDPRFNHKLTDEDRESAQEIRAIRFEIKRMQEKARLLEAKRELQELQEELSDYEDNSEDDEMTKWMPLIAPFLGKMGAGGQPHTPPQNIPPKASPPVSTGTVGISDDEIRIYLKQQHLQHIVMAKSLPKALLFRKVREKLPLTDEECERVYNILMTEF